MNLRTAAKGMKCTLNFDVCNFDTETTVLAHLRGYGDFGQGMGKKPDDRAAVLACNKCHDCLDGRIPMSKHDRLLRDWHVARALIRTRISRENQ